MTAAIRFKNVSKVYPNYALMTQGLKNLILSGLQGKNKDLRRGFTAFEDVSFEIQPGEAVGVIGRNGAGKSTMLGLMARVLRPNSGTVDVVGRVTPLLELGGGFHPDLSGRENIILNSVLLGMTQRESREKSAEIIEFADIGAFIDRPVRTYSTGMTARLGFAVAAHLDPDILLVDEVLSVGDFAFQAKCEKVFADFRNRGVTVVLVSHSHSLVKEVCGRCLWIENHRLRADGPSADVVAEYLKGHA